MSTITLYWKTYLIRSTQKETENRVNFAYARLLFYPVKKRRGYTMKFIAILFSIFMATQDFNNQGLCTLEKLETVFNIKNRAVLYGVYAFSDFILQCSDHNESKDENEDSFEHDYFKDFFNDYFRDSFEDYFGDYFEDEDF